MTAETKDVCDMCGEGLTYHETIDSYECTNCGEWYCDHRTVLTNENNETFNYFGEGGWITDLD